ncbi:50S ribosomal protein L15 [Patescibacteria group bacterium]
MELHELTKHKTTKKHRAGRGIGSGLGKTAGRGTKGQKARSGHRKMRPGFEGGKTPLIRLMPKKRGFTSRRYVFSEITLADLEKHFKKGDKVDRKTLRSAGLVKDPKKPIKILAQGELKKELSLIVHGASAKAQEAIKKAGGDIRVIPVRPSRGKKNERKDKPADQ